MLAAGKLRHRVIIQRPVDTQDTTSGAVVRTWSAVATVWSAIEPLSAREFIAAQAEDSKVSARVTIRYRSDISHEMRLYHQAKNKYYNIEGILADKNSGLEYLTIPVSEGIRHQESIDVIPVVLENPEINETSQEVTPMVLEMPVIVETAYAGFEITATQGVWANDPDSYTYQWYLDDVAITGATTLSLVTPYEIGGVLTFGVIATNLAGSSAEAFSEEVTIVEYVPDLTELHLMSSNGIGFPNRTFTNSGNTKNIVQYKKRHWLPVGSSGENVQLVFINKKSDGTNESVSGANAEVRKVKIHYDGSIYDVTFEGEEEGTVAVGAMVYSDVINGFEPDYETAPYYDEVGYITYTVVTSRLINIPIYARFGEFHYQSQLSDGVDFLDGTEIPLGTEDLTATVGAGTISGVTVVDGGENWSGSVTVWAWEEQSDGYVRDVQIGTATLTGDAISAVSVTMNEDDWVSPTVYAVPPLVGADTTGFLSSQYAPSSSFVVGMSADVRNNVLCVADSIFDNTRIDAGFADINGNTGLFERGVNNRWGAFNAAIGGSRINLLNDPAAYPLLHELVESGLFDKALIAVWGNDLAWSRTPADIIADIVIMRDWLQAQDIEVQISTNPPRTSSSDGWVTTTNQTILSGSNGKKFWYESPSQTLSLGSGVNTSMEMEAIDTDMIVFNDDTNDTFQVWTLGTDLEWTLSDDLAVANSGYYCGMTKVATDTFAHMDSNGSTGRVLKKYLFSAGTLAAVGGYSLAFTGANVVSLAYLGSNYLVSYTDNDDKLQLVQDTAGNYAKVGSGQVVHTGFTTIKVCKLNATTVAICSVATGKIEAYSVDLGTGAFTKLGEITLTSFIPVAMSGFNIFDMEYRLDNNIAFVDPTNRRIYFLSWSGTEFTPSASLLTVGGTNTINICFPSSTRIIVAIQSTALMKAYDYVNGQLIPVGGDMLSINASIRAGTITQDFDVLDTAEVYADTTDIYLWRDDQALDFDASVALTNDGVHTRTALGQLYGGTSLIPLLFAGG